MNLVPHRHTLEEIEVLLRLIEKIGEKANITININIQSIKNVSNSTLDRVNVSEIQYPQK